MSKALLADIFGLMAVSPVHRHWTIADVERLILPPLIQSQHQAVYADGRLVAFGTWALLDRRAERGLTKGHRLIQPEDWTAGHRAWVMDVIAPYGHARTVCRKLRSAMKNDGIDRVKFRRNKGGPRRYSEVKL